MRRIFYFFIFITFSALCFQACVGDPYNNGQQYPGNTTHTYPNSNGQSTIDSDPSLTDIEVSNEDTDRFVWQKPKEVIRRLGNGLSEKTVADIGAGPSGYFTFQFVKVAKKVIAIDINKDAIAYLDSVKFDLRERFKDKIETRLVPEDDPMLARDEADIVFISNTFAYINDPIEYLQKVKNGMPIGGQICIVDYKMRKIPSVFHPVEDRIPLYKVEEELEEAGFRHLISYDDVLEYQYIVIAEKFE